MASGMSKVYPVSAEVRVLGGFPVIAQGYMHPEDREVGINSEYLEDVRITTLKGKPCPFIESKLSKADWVGITTQLMGAL